MERWESEKSRQRGLLFKAHAVTRQAPWHSTPPNLAAPLFALPPPCHRLATASHALGEPSRYSVCTRAIGCSPVAHLDIASLHTCRGGRRVVHSDRGGQHDSPLRPLVISVHGPTYTETCSMPLLTALTLPGLLLVVFCRALDGSRWRFNLWVLQHLDLDQTFELECSIYLRLFWIEANWDFSAIICIFRSVLAMVRYPRCSVSESVSKLRRLCQLSCVAVLVHCRNMSLQLAMHTLHQRLETIQVLCSDLELFVMLGVVLMGEILWLKP